MEQCHEEDLRKLMADHNQLEAHVRRPQGDEHFAHTLLLKGNHTPDVASLNNDWFNSNELNSRNHGNFFFFFSLSFFLHCYSFHGN